MVYQFPNYAPQPARLKSCGIDPGVVQRLTVVDNQAHYRQYPGIDTTQHRKTVRRLKRRMQRCREAALRDGRARWVNLKRRDGKTRRRFRWTTKPSRKYLQTLAQLRNVEHKRIKTLRAEEHRITTQIVQDHQLIAIEDTAIGNMTRSAKGTVEEPGRNVAQKRGLNRSILSQRWFAISQKLEYKSRWYGPAVRQSPSGTHQPNVPRMRSRRRREPTDAGDVPVHELPAGIQRRRSGGRKHAAPRGQPRGGGRKSGYAGPGERP